MLIVNINWCTGGVYSYNIDITGLDYKNLKTNHFVAWIKVKNHQKTQEKKWETGKVNVHFMMETVL